MTDADREKAFRVLGWHESWGLSDLNMEDRNEVEAIAAALAEERAPYEAVLAGWERSGDVTRMWLAREFREAVNGPMGKLASEETK